MSREPQDTPTSRMQWAMVGIAVTIVMTLLHAIFVALGWIN